MNRKDKPVPSPYHKEFGKKPTGIREMAKESEKQTKAVMRLLGVKKVFLIVPEGEQEYHKEDPQCPGHGACKVMSDGFDPEGIVDILKELLDNLGYDVKSRR